VGETKLTEENPNQSGVYQSPAWQAGVEKTRTHTYVLTTSIIFGACGLLGIAPAAMTDLWFHQAIPNNFTNVAWYLSVFTFPAICALAIASSWIFYRLHLHPLARGVALLPLINVIIGAVAALNLYFHGVR